MRILLIIFLFINFLSCFAAENAEVYSVKDKFGITNKQNKITEAKYSKLIQLGDNSYIFMKNNKYGIIQKDGTILLDNRFYQAKRYIGKYVVLGRNGKYGLYDEFADTIIEPEYTSIKILYGKMFLVCKNYKYGLISFNGDILLAPIADDIYMPQSNVLKLKYDGTWYEISQTDNETLNLADDIEGIDIINNDITVAKVLQNPAISAGYGIVNTSDYIIKIFSSISPAYEQTIDELVLNNGADAVSILMKCSWLYKFPYVYARNYTKNIKTPNNGPLSEIKLTLRNKMSNL